MPDCLPPHSLNPRPSFSILIIELASLLGGGILVLLVLGHQIAHVGLGLGELHLVHALASVPV